jgi:hypothetical protein
MRPSDEQSKQLEALCRAMSITRMVDYGMKHESAALAHRLLREGKPWDLVLEEMARQERVNAEAVDDPVLARECWHAAAASLNFAQMVFNADGDRKRDLHRQMTRCFARFAALAEYPVRRMQGRPLCYPRQGQRRWCTGPGPAGQPAAGPQARRFRSRLERTRRSDGLRWLPAGESVKNAPGGKSVDRMQWLSEPFSVAAGV